MSAESRADVLLVVVHRLRLRAGSEPRKSAARTSHRFAQAGVRFLAVIDDAVDQCRRDPERPAQLIRLLLDARDAETGAALSDDEDGASCGPS